MYGVYSLAAIEGQIREKRERYEAEAAQERLALAARPRPQRQAGGPTIAVQPGLLAQTCVAPCCEGA